MHRYKLLFFVWLAFLGLSTEASANGRFPRSQKLIRDPTNQERMVLSGTFGLALSRDGGQSWVYICEASYSDPNTILDPLVAFAKDGTLYTGTLLDLRRSDPDLCEFDVVLGQPGELVPDFTLDVDGQSLLAVVSTIADGKDQATVEASPDGTAWEPLGPPIEERSVLTLDVAPSDPQRLYITALAPELDEQGQEVGQRGVLLVSKDRGESFQEFDIPGTSFEAQPFIAAVHPTDADVVYVRLSAQKLDDLDLPVADDALLVSRDGGQSFSELIRQPAKLFAFALSPDATTVLAGFGGPDDTTIGYDRRQLGLYRLTGVDGEPDTAEVDHFLTSISAHCLTWTPQGLYVCLRQFEAGFEVGFTEDYEFTDLDEVTSVLLLNELEGPTTCPAGSEGAVCAERWETDCQPLYICGSAPEATDGGVAASSGTDGGVATGGADAAAGTAGGAQSAAAGSPPDTAEATSGKLPETSNCACHFVGASRWFGADGGVMLMWLGLSSLGLGWSSRRRRMSTQSKNTTKRGDT